MIISPLGVVQPPPRAIERIPFDAWRRGAFEHRFKHLGYTNPYSGEKIWYTDIKFNAAEVEGAWPKSESSGDNSALSRMTAAPPRRDTPLSDALTYAVTGSWGGVLDGEQMIEDLNVRLREFEQAARDGELLVWGKEQMNGLSYSELFELIEPDTWKHQRVHWFSLVLEEHARTENRAGSQSDCYGELMVSREQIEEKWPHG